MTNKSQTDKTGLEAQQALEKYRQKCAKISCHRQKKRGCEGFCLEHWREIFVNKDKERVWLV